MQFGTIVYHCVFYMDPFNAEIFWLMLRHTYVCLKDYCFSAAIISWCCLYVASDAADKNDDECKEFIPLSVFRRKHTPHWYGRRIAKFGRAGKVGKVCA